MEIMRHQHEVKHGCFALSRRDWILLYHAGLSKVPGWHQLSQVMRAGYFVIVFQIKCIGNEPLHVCSAKVYGSYSPD